MKYFFNLFYFLSLVIVCEFLFVTQSLAIQPSIKTCINQNNQGFISDNLQGNILDNEHPISILLSDPKNLNKGVFDIYNCTPPLANNVRMEVYDSNGNLLTVKSVMVNTNQPLRVSWVGLPTGTSSVALFMDSKGNQSYISIPQESSVKVTTTPVSEFTSSAKTNNGSGIIIYNQSNNLTNIVIDGYTTDTVDLFPHELHIVAPIQGKSDFKIYASQGIVMLSGAIIGDYLRFQEPVKEINVPTNCNLGGACIGSATNLHTGRDYMARPTRVGVRIPS